MRARVKICGITRPSDAQGVAALGADAIGLVFYEHSPRAVNAEQARGIVAALPPFVTVVGLFVNAPADFIRAVLDEVPLDVLQFHGNEPPQACRGFGRPYIKAFAMREGFDLEREAAPYGDAMAWLLDGYSPTLPGGTGRTFDWDRVPARMARPVILSGGLTPENVVQAIRKVRPAAVDVSSGVELEKGVKDLARVEALIRGVHSVEI